MNSKERILAAIRHEVPDRIPVAVLEIEKEYEFSNYLGIENHEPMVHPDIGYYSPAYAQVGIDCFRLEMAYTEDPGLSPADEPLNEWGVVARKDYSADNWYPLGDADSIADIEKHAWPDPDKFDYARAAEKAAAISSEYAVRGPHWYPLLCRVFELMGMEETLVNMSCEPEVFEAALERVFEVSYACTERLIEACGDHMPIVCGADDFGSQRGLMLSPDAWRKYLKPRYAKLFEMAKKHGKFVWFHSCGDISPVLPDLIDIGMDVWETVQLHTLPMSPEELKCEYGKHITFFGAVNSQRLPFQSTDEVRNEVRRCIDLLGEGGGYICSADHGIRADVPNENIEALFSEACKYRRPGYTLLTD